MDQVPKDILCGNCKHKSHWAVFLIILIIILFGLFWLAEAPIKVPPTQTNPIVQSPETNETKNPTSDLEASVGAIDIPSYSDEL